ncbi:hypothetical protein [Sphingorhabdus sp. M41]|uniref:hypothetical protein n=1 Tax=Sphingorhabdus sp. M41 TaxID=1806885 RepID=UPI00078D5B5E|nr:hypothetical protein [Sphingorhabdus sp. M41]AMO71832.1 hypothetical protein AZE99_08195 [Sphingorhabdus sp. M41]
MNIEFVKVFRPLLLATTMAVTVAPAPASAQFGGIFGSKSQNEKTEAPQSNDNRDAASEIPDTATITPDGEVGTTERTGASSFGTLCGNGQGKPDETEAKVKRKGLFGMADRMASVTRKIPLVGDFLVDSANNLSQAISCRLYPEEQEQAAEATQVATEGGEIGKTVEWQSRVRENVSGSSTVSSKNALPDGTPCMVLADIVIVDGEELKVSKTMCKLPGAARYTIMQS